MQANRELLAKPSIINGGDAVLGRVSWNRVGGVLGRQPTQRRRAQRCTHAAAAAAAGGTHSQSACLLPLRPPQYPWFVSVRAFDGAELTADGFDYTPDDVEPPHDCGGMMLATSACPCHAKREAALQRTPAPSRARPAHAHAPPPHPPCSRADNTFYKYVLTAAHCFLDANGAKDNTTPMVIIGAYKNAWNDQNWAQVQVRTTYGTFCHPLCERVWGRWGSAARLIGCAGGNLRWRTTEIPEGMALAPLTRRPPTQIFVSAQTAAARMRMISASSS